MQFVSLYRKWRPQVFADVVGQEHVVRTLTNALDQKRVGHAYLFAGPRGTGKTTIARLLAKGLNCQSGPTGSPCGECDACRRIAEGHFVDVLEVDGASNRGIDEVREIRERVKYAPAQGLYKVYIIDEVHMLTTEAFNALLKVLEEPPSHVVFVFATTEQHKIPATILSRCQNFDFRSLSAADMVGQLRRIAEGENVVIDDGALALIVRHAEGGMRDAIGFLDQAIAFAEGPIDEDLISQVLGVVRSEMLDALAEVLIERDLKRGLLLVKECVDLGRDVRQWASDAARYFRDLTLLALIPDDETLLVLSKEQRSRRLQLAKDLGVKRLVDIVERLGQAESDMRYAPSASLVMELALIDLIQEKKSTETDQSTDVAAAGVPFTGMQSLFQRIEALEKKLGEQERLRPHARPSALVPGPFGSSSPSPTDHSSQSEQRATGAGSQSSQSRFPGPFTADRAQTPSDSPSAETRPKTDLEASSEEQPVTKGEARPESTPVIIGETGQQHDQAATPQANADATDLVATVKRLWPDLLRALRERKAMQQAAFLMEGTPGSAEGNTIFIYFSENHGFHKANIENEKNKVIIETILSTLVGRDIRIMPVTGTPPEVANPEEGALPHDVGDAAGDEAGAQGGTHAGDGAATNAGFRGGAAGQAAGHASAPAGPDQQGTAPGPEDRPLHPDPEIEKAIRSEPLIRKALEMFGGTITKIERKDVDSS